MVFHQQLRMSEHRLEIRRGKKNYEVNLFYGDQPKAIYHNILTNDVEKLALILDDLETFGGLPVIQAIKIYLRKRENRKDWLGL